MGLLLACKFKWQNHSLIKYKGKDKNFVSVPLKNPLYLQLTSDSSQVGGQKVDIKCYLERLVNVKELLSIMDKAVNLYRKVAKFPQAVNATVISALNKDYDVIETVQSQRDLERAEKIKFSRSYFVKQCDGGKFDILYRSSTQEVANEVWSKVSPSGRFRAIVRKVVDKKKDEKQYIEIWEGNAKIENFDITAAEKHGKLYDPDVYFGCLEWSNKEDKLLYAAEKKCKKPVSYFAKPSDDEKEKQKVEQGEEYVVREEWGEGFVGKHIPVLCVLTIETGEISVLEGVPDGLSAGLGKWLPGDKKIVFTGWDHEPYRLGIIYCPIRKSTLYTLDLNTGTCTPITPSDRASKCPILSRDKSCFVFLDTNIGGPHMQCSRLLKYNIETEITTIITEEIHTVKDEEFPGLYCINLPSQCWSEDGKRVVVNSVWKRSHAAIIINTDTKHVVRLPSACGGDITVLCLVHDLVVAQCSAPNQPHYLVVGKLPNPGEETNIVWTSLEENSTRLDSVCWKLYKHVPTTDRVNAVYPSLDYESILVYPKTTDQDKKTNFLVFPHGGPHSVFTTDFMLYVYFLCELGFSVLMVNYRGSAGYGMDTIYSLPGKVGDQDVKDVQMAAEEVITAEGYDKTRVCVSGGSHGGFLTCHLIGQYPGFYKAALCRNPVINIATMFGSTDIPDWAFVESGLDFDFKSLPDAAACEKMWKCSPLQYVDQISCPVMIMVGQDDKRCPPKQSYELYKALKARNKPVRFLAYPENGHPIVKVDSEADAFINAYKWFSEHLPSQ